MNQRWKALDGVGGLKRQNPTACMWTNLASLFVSWHYLVELWYYEYLCRRLPHSLA